MASRFAVNEAAVGTTRVVNITPLVRTQTRNLVVSGNVSGVGLRCCPGLAVENVSVTNDANGFVIRVRRLHLLAGVSVRPCRRSVWAIRSIWPLPLTATVVMRAL